MFKKYLTQILLVLALLGVAWGLFLLGEEPEEENKKVVQEKPIEASIYQTAGDIVQKENPSEEKSINPELIPIRNWSVQDPEILAQAAIIISFNPTSKSNILFQKNRDEILPIASLTKIMTGIIALENFDLEEVVEVSKNSVLTLGDKGGLIRGEELKIKDLLHIMLIESSNDAAMALASDNPRLNYDEFLNLMNTKAAELGLEHTKFLDPVGLNSKNKSTAHELAYLAKHALDFPLLWEILKIPKATIYSIDNKFIHNLANTNKLLEKIPFLKGGKTGYTNDAGGCMLTVSEVQDSLGFNNHLITVVLGSDDREQDTETLIIWAKEAYIW
jgi:D-alanyl-D-alanine carboxypeptidase